MPMPNFPHIPPFRPFIPPMSLPAVYGDELSYMELLGKAEKWLSDLVESNNLQNAAIVALYAAWEEFKNGGYTDSFEQFLDQWFADNQEHIDELLTGQFADELAAIQETADGAVQTATEAEQAVSGKVNMPTGGTNGQVLSKAATSTGTDWTDPIIPTDEQTETYITKWLNEHPEATTTVTDGAVTLPKLASSLLYTLQHYESISATIAADVYNRSLANLKGNTFSWVSRVWFDDSPVTAGSFWVFTIAERENVSFAQQIVFLENGGGIFMRNKPASGTYGAWHGIKDMNEVYSYKLPSIQATDDMDNFTERGVFYHSTSTEPPTNAPIASAFTLRVDVLPSVIVQTVQNIVGDCDIYRRYKIANQPWSTWESNQGAPTELANSLLFTLQHYETIDATKATDVYGGLLSNLSGNTFAWVSNTWFDDSPVSSGAFWVFTVAASANVTFSHQIVLLENGGGIFMRHKPANGTYGAWHGISDMNNVYAYKLPLIQATDDMDNFTERGVFYHPTSTAAPTNAPVASAFTMRVDVVPSIVVQTVQTSVYRLDVYRRYKINNNAWSVWEVINSRYANTAGVYYAFGDSTTRGQIGGGSGNTPFGYPRITADHLGMKVNNKAIGGQGLCKDWAAINNTIDSLDMSDATLITVGWFYNDASTWATLPMGDYTSITDTTVIGRYYTIMKKLQEKCKTAQVILVTTYGYPTAIDNHATLTQQFTAPITFADGQSTWGELFDEVERMCNLHGWPCVNQHHGCALNQFNADRLIGDQIHPTVEGYWVYGNNLAAQIGKYYTNMSPRGF